MNIKSKSANVISLLSYISFISRKKAIIVDERTRRTEKTWEKTNGKDEHTSQTEKTNRKDEQKRRTEKMNGKDERQTRMEKETGNELCKRCRKMNV